MKRFIKNIIFAVALIFILPLALPELLLRKTLHRDVLFPGQAELLSLFPGKIGRYLRNAYYFLTLKKCPLDCCFLLGMAVTHSEAEIGHRVYAGAYSNIGIATIGDDTMLSDHVYVLSGGRQHGTAEQDKSFQQQEGSYSRVHVGANSWLGVHAVIMADVGKNCVIGASSVVTHSIPDDSVAVGSPARVLKSTAPQTGASAADAR